MVKTESPTVPVPGPLTPVRFNAAPVTRVGAAIFVALPRSAWRPVPGGCSCHYCTPDRGTPVPAWWDTLAVSQVPGVKGADVTWTVHRPESHGIAPKRSP